MFEEDDSELDPTPASSLAPDDEPIESDSSESALGAITKILSGPSKRETAILGEMRSSAEEARQALRDARARILKQRINPADPWLAASQAFLSPTKTGRFGENIGNVAGALRDYSQRETELEGGKNSDLTKLALTEAGLNNPALSAELSFEKIRQQMAARLLAGAGKGVHDPADLVMWKELTKTLTPEQAAQARKIKLGMNAKAGTFSVKTVDGVPTAVGVDADSGEAISIPLTTIAAQSKGAQDIKTAEKTGTDLGEEYSKIQAGAPAAQAKLNQVDQLERLLGDLDSGSLAQAGVKAAELAKSFGIDIDPKLGAKQAALAIGNGLALQLRNPSAGAGMPGSLSNSDRDFLVSMLPSLMQTKDGRRQLIASMRLMAQRDMDVAKLAREYKQEHGQYDEYFYDKLAQWSDQNPIFSHGLQRPKNANAEVWYHLSAAQQAEAIKKIASMEPKKARGGRVAYQKGGAVTLDDGTELPLDEPEEKKGSTKSSADTSELKSVYDMLLGAGAGAGVGLGVDALLPRGPKLRPAEQRVVSTLEHEQVDPQQALQRLEGLQRAGTPATLMTDPSMRGLSETALASASPAESRASLEELERQHEGARGRIDTQVQQGLKPTGSYFQTQKNLTSALYSNSKPLYEALYKKYPGVVISPEIGEIFKTDTGKAAIKEAIRLMDIEGNPIGKVDALGVVKKPSLQFLDYVKRGLDSMVEKVEPNGVPSTEGRALRNLRTKFRDAVDAAAPGDYKAARQQYAGDLEVRDALEEGRLFHKFQPEELQARANGMSKAEKSAFRTGISQRLMEYIDSPTADVDTARRIVGSPKMLQSLKPFFDTPQEFDVFQRALAQEVELFGSTRELMNAGKRGQMQRQRGDQESRVRNAAREVTGFDMTRPLNWATRILNRVPDMTQEQANEVLRILQSNDPAAMASFSRRIGAVKAKKPMTGRRALVAGAATLAGAGVGALLDHEQE